MARNYTKLIGPDDTTGISGGGSTSALLKTGGTMTGVLILASTQIAGSTSGRRAATVAYVDGVAAGQTGVAAKLYQNANFR